MKPYTRQLLAAYVVAGVSVLGGLDNKLCFGQAPQAVGFTMAKVSDLPYNTQMHGSAVVGDRLYVFGGENSQGWSNSVFSAELQPGGKVGVWKEEKPLPDRRSYIGNGVVVMNNRIYILAGASAKAANSAENTISMKKDVIWTSVEPGGELAPWKMGSEFPEAAKANVATCISDNYMYMLGGNSGKTISDSILRADFAPDGTPQNWTRIAGLPIPLWFHAAAVLDRRLYVWGGLTGSNSSTASKRVFSTDVLKDGTLGTWREEGAMPSAAYSAATCGFNDYLISLGGRTMGGKVVNTLHYARLQNGSVGPWTALTTNLEGQVYHTLGLDTAHGWVFVTGGHRKLPVERAADDLIKSVYGFKIGDEGATAKLGIASANAHNIDDLVQAGKPVLIYFRSPKVPAAVRFEQAVMSQPAFKELTAAYEVRTFDTSEDHSLSYKYSVFRVPTLVLIKPDKYIKRSTALQSLEEVKEFLTQP